MHARYSMTPQCHTLPGGGGRETQMKSLHIHILLSVSLTHTHTHPPAVKLGGLYKVVCCYSNSTPPQHQLEADATVR